MLRKWMPKRVRVQLFILLVGHLLSYYGAKYIIRDSSCINMALPFDGRIPLVPWTVIIYYGCFLFWIYNYTIILRTEPIGTYRFMCAELLGKLICFVTYILVPTIMIRPDIIGTGIFTHVISMMYAVDTPDALFPSMHCFVSWMCVVGLRGKPEISNKYRAFSVVAALLVFIATLTTKQHVVVDVISAVILAELVYFIAAKLPVNRRVNSDTGA